MTVSQAFPTLVINKPKSIVGISNKIGSMFDSAEEISNGLAHQNWDLPAEIQNLFFIYKAINWGSLHIIWGWSNLLIIRNSSVTSFSSPSTKIIIWEYDKMGCHQNCTHTLTLDGHIEWCTNCEHKCCFDINIKYYYTLFTEEFNCTFFSTLKAYIKLLTIKLNHILNAWSPKGYAYISLTT